MAIRNAGHGLNDDDLLALMARALLATGTDARGGRDGQGDAGRANHQIHITVCERCGHGEQQAGGERVTVRPEVVEAAQCDCVTVPAEPTEPTDEQTSTSPRGREPNPEPRRPRGRARQSVPPALRRAVFERDKGRCAVSGCRHRAFFDLHHLKLLSESGRHLLDNLILLCPIHHGAVHDGRLVIRGTRAEDLQFFHADGSTYGVRRPEMPRIDHHRRAFTVLCGLGFGQGQVRAALDAVTAHVGGSSGRPADTETLVREALSRLREGIVSVRDEGPGYVARPYLFQPPLGANVTTL